MGTAGVMEGVLQLLRSGPPPGRESALAALSNLTLNHSCTTEVARAPEALSELVGEMLTGVWGSEGWAPEGLGCLGGWEVAMGLAELCVSERGCRLSLLSLLEHVTVLLVVLVAQDVTRRCCSPWLNPKPLLHKTLLLALAKPY
jgi:hypothetical protein